MMINLDFKDNEDTIGGVDFIGVGQISGWIMSKKKILEIKLIVEEKENKDLITCGIECKKVIYGLTREDIYDKYKQSSYLQSHQSGFFALINFFSLNDSFICVSLKIKFASGKYLRSKNIQIQSRDMDSEYLHEDVKLSDAISHLKWPQKLSQLANKKGLRILEIGSREVVSKSKRDLFPNAEYIGFDIYEGPNVDVVGDAHKLSSYFNKKFDLIFSSAVFEHLAMPWVVAEEISQLLNINGYVFIETHYSFSSHERPWHFFQYSEQALKVLFSPALGFRCLEAGVSNPIVGRFSLLADNYLRGNPVRGLYCHSEYLGQKIVNVDDFKWNKVDLADLVQGSKYPEPQKE
jgi:hypothetical protein